MIRSIKALIAAKKETKRLEDPNEVARKNQEFRENLIRAEREKLHFFKVALALEDQLKINPQNSETLITEALQALTDFDR